MRRSLTVELQPDRYYARPAQDKRRRLHHSVPVAIQPCVPQGAAPANGQGLGAGPVRRGRASAGGKGSSEAARPV
jgi:hypothetical protein